MTWFMRWYGRRIVNVNVNILVAGALALAITVGVMHLFQEYGLDWRIHDELAQKLGSRWTLKQTAIISAVTFVVDLIADVAVYYLLHWLANHLPRKLPRIIEPAYANLSFMKDATIVQAQRAILSPLLYVIALGLQWYMLHHDSSVGVATAVGFGVGIVTTRILHTTWMLWVERRARRDAARAIETRTHPPAAEPRD